MAQARREPRPQFSQPVRQILSMMIVLGLAGSGAFLALPNVRPVFEANPYLNGFILFVFFIGVIACFWQVFTLIGSVRWIERFAAGETSASAKAPRLLASLASLLRARGAQSQLGAASTRSILDSVATRVDEAREITRYIVNLLIFLGLLGTFYGLATTVPAVVDTIRSLAPQDGEEGVEVFNRLMTGLEAQLGGMGVAFSSSLLGLAGSLIVGLLELFAGHGQNRFYRELEEWLSSITQVGFTSGEDGGASDAIGHALDHMAAQMDALQSLFAHSDENRAKVDRKLDQLVDSIRDMTDRMDRTDTSTEALDRVAQGQERLLEYMRDHADQGIDAESRMRLRSIDVQMLRILEEISAGRQESLTELRRGTEGLIRVLAERTPRPPRRPSRPEDIVPPEDS